MQPVFTSRQGQYLAFIYHFAKINRQSPSEADMQKYFNVSAPSVHQIVLSLEADGWFCVRPKGSHQQYRHPSRPDTVIFAGKPSVEVSPGTLNSVLKQSGLKK